MKTGVPHISRAGLVFGELRVFMRTDGRFAIFDKRKPIADQSVGVFGRIDEAIAEAKRLAALDEPAKARGEKKYDGDAEAFAGMKRARENGFAPHEPALTHAELHQLNAAASTMDRACELAYEAMTHEIEALPLAALHAGMMRALDEQRETQTGFYGPATDFAPGLAPKIVITVNDVEIKGEVLTRPDCPKCGVGFCELDCSCACHLEELSI